MTAYRSMARRVKIRSLVGFLVCWAALFAAIVVLYKITGVI
jgi:hypothetical protein